MSLQPWYCEECKVIGCVEYDPNAGVSDVFYLLAASHHKESPKCNRKASDLRCICNDSYLKHRKTTADGQIVLSTADEIAKLQSEGYTLSSTVMTEKEAKKHSRGADEDNLFSVVFRALRGER